MEMASTIDANIDFWLISTIVSIFILMLIKLISIRRRAMPSTPPGPYQLPVIGNLLQMGKNPHIKLRDMARTYGPIMSIKLGSRLVVVGSSPEAAMEILKTHDSVLSGRHVTCTHPASSPEFNRYTIGFAEECSAKWKQLRTICRAGLFNARSIHEQVKIRERNVRNMVKYLHAREGHVVDMSDLIFKVVINTLCNILFSRDVFGFEFDEQGPAFEMKRLLREFVDLLASPNMGDLFPVLHGWDIQGKQKNARHIYEKFFAVWEKVLKERREMRNEGIVREDDLLDVLLGNGFTDEHINHLMLELLLAGTDTTTTTIIWVLADLMKNQHAMHKLSDEIESAVGDEIIIESDVIHLPYLQACLKETLRLHPPIPFLLPHRAIKTCKVMNYTIPEGSQVIVNTWAMSRDPCIWKDPSSFTPEHFIDSGLDFKGNDFQFLPFGSGRRMCPGLPMAACQIPYAVASLVHSFNWFLPGYKSQSELDMDEEYHLSLGKKQPLKLIPQNCARISIENKKVGE